jgi:hypothetical protein
MNPMIPIPQRWCPSVAYAARLLFAMALGNVVAPLFGADADGKPPVMMQSVVVSEAKTHSLFMGADISVDFQHDLRPVKDVFGASWVILVDGQERHISTKEATVGLQCTPSLKLTDTFATVAHFMRTPGYSFENDPSYKITKGLTRAAVTSSMMQGVAHDAQDKADTMGNKALGGAVLFAESDQQFGDGALMHTAQVTGAIVHYPKAQPGAAVPSNPLVPSTMLTPQQEAQEQASDAFAMAANGTEPLSGEVTSIGHDAMDVAFDVSSNKPLRNPYVVTIARFHPKGTKPGTVQNLVYAQALDPIDAHAVRVQFEETGYPPEFELLDFQFHLYDKGKEVATSISDKRVDMTRDEAFEYVKMEYMSVHRGDTLPPVPVMGNLPADLPTVIAVGKYPDTFYVRVTKRGQPGDLFADDACTKPIDDPYLRSAVRGLLFKPALAHGKAVEGVAAVNLAKLQI